MATLNVGTFNVVLVFVVLLSTALAVISIDEESALRSLYEEGNGRGWVGADTWATPLDPCSWEGVVCDDAGVLELYLRGFGYEGTLSSKISTLSYLQLLDVSANHISRIPEDLFTNLTALTLVDVSSNDLAVLPASLLVMKNLKYLVLAHNNLATIPNVSGLHSLGIFYFLSLPTPLTKNFRKNSFFSCLGCL